MFKIWLKHLYMIGKSCPFSCVTNPKHSARHAYVRILKSGVAEQDAHAPPPSKILADWLIPFQLVGHIIPPTLILTLTDF